MKKLPLGIQNFRKIVDGGYIYVDKTHYIYNLINDASYYFLSRPRRFGKSLLLDTIAETFCGDKELFKGLWIYDSDYSFEKHPVLRLDMSDIANKTPETLESELTITLKNRALKENFDIGFDSPSAFFKTLIEMLHEKYGRRVVVLIDEYDKPILDHLQDAETAEANRTVLRGFYGILKSMDPFLRFTFITGVTKFTKTSIFSGLNNLYDITLDRAYSNICGVAVEDLSELFSGHIEDIAAANGSASVERVSDEILEWYDGYSWDGKSRVINPYSLLSFFKRKSLESFWYASGTPTFLLKLLKEKPASFLSLKDLEVSERVFDTFDIRRISVASLLFQTGYLTVKRVVPGSKPSVYQLEIPNLEVREALYLNLISEFTEQDESLTETTYYQVKETLKTGNLEAMLRILKGLFASIPYQLHIDREAYYHSIFYAVMSVLGFDMEAEISTSKGRIDAVLELENKVYVMEFKYHDCEPDTAPEAKRKLFDKALEEGMAQIKEMGYADKFAGSGKDVRLAALAFLGRDDIEMRTETL